MKFVLLQAQTRQGLEVAVNTWLLQYGVVSHDDPTAFVSQYSIAIFYVPLKEN